MPRFGDHFGKAWFEDRYAALGQLSDLGPIGIDTGDPISRLSETRTTDETDIARANYRNPHYCTSRAVLDFWLAADCVAFRSARPNRSRGIDPCHGRLSIAGDAQGEIGDRRVQSLFQTDFRLPAQ